MLNLDPPKLLVISVVAVILLGPNKLPDFARQVGAAWRTFTAFRERMELEVRNSIPVLPSPTDLAEYVRSPSAFLDRLASPGPEADLGAARAGLVSDLPTIGGPERPHWTSVSHDAPTDSSAERERGDTESRVIGDAALN